MNELIFASWLNCLDVIRYLLACTKTFRFLKALFEKYSCHENSLTVQFPKWRLTNITKYVIGLHKMLSTVYFQAHFTFSAESHFSACPSCSSFYPKQRIRPWRKSRNCSCPRNTKPRGKRNRRKSTSTTTADTWIVPKCDEPEKYIPDVKHLQLSYDLTQLPVCRGSRYPFVHDVKSFCIILFANLNILHL